jgi:hypothetical protein
MSCSHSHALGKAVGVLLAGILLSASGFAQEREVRQMKKGPSAADGGLVTTDLTATTVSDVIAGLFGPLVLVTNVSYTGSDLAAGLFSGGTGIVGFEGGIILSSGAISNVIGPNDSPAATYDLGLPGDSDLDTLIPGFLTYDATVLEFDVECPGATDISFQYVFSSEEYNEWVFTDYNDPFAFYLNGVNIAEVPGAPGTPVAIDTVNCGNPYNPPLGGSHCDLFVNNQPPVLDTEMDGLTLVFSATGTLQPGPNHVKLAIADAGDHRFDSNVFLRGESFVCDLPAPVFEPPTPCDQTVKVFPGDLAQFDVAALATNGLSGQHVTLTASGVPAGAVFTPPLPTSGQPATATFSWTPGEADIGTHVITLTATDQLGDFTTCDVSILVSGVASLYGCGLNPAGSMVIIDGSFNIGDSFTLGVHNPLGTQPAGSLAFLGLAILPDPHYPCGTPGISPRFGMDPLTDGEILISIVPPFLLQPIHGPVTWDGVNPAPFHFTIPPQTALVGVKFYAQGLLVTPFSALIQFGTTEGFQAIIGG